MGELRSWAATKVSAPSGAKAGAHVARGDLDGAVNSAHQAVDHMGGVISARDNSPLSNLRSKLADHQGGPVVREFLESTA